MNKSSGWGTSIALLIWAAILFLFAQWPGEPGALMWTARVLALLSLLVGVLVGCTSYATREDNLYKKPELLKKDGEA